VHDAWGGGGVDSLMRLANQKGRARGVKIDAGVFVFGGMQFISKNKKIKK
jgi:hypothetical protein